MKKKPKGLKTAVWIAIGVIAILALALIFGWIVQVLWNATQSSMFDWREITYWQALGLFILAKLMFGFGVGDRGAPSAKLRGRHGHGEPSDPTTADDAGSEDLAGLADDDRFRRFWAAEGKAAWSAFKNDGGDGSPT